MIDRSISYDDLKQYRAIERNPIKFNYRGYTIYSMPLPSSGGITLANILNQLEHLWTDHKKLVIGAIVVLVIAIIL